MYFCFTGAHRIQVQGWGKFARAEVEAKSYRWREPTFQTRCSEFADGKFGFTIWMSWKGKNDRPIENTSSSIWTGDQRQGRDHSKKLWTYWQWAKYPSEFDLDT